MKKQIIIIILAVTANLFFNQVKAQVPLGLKTQLQDTLVAMQTTYGYKGLSVSVGYKNFGIWKSSVGESTTGIALTTDDLIGIGSNTKTFVSAMMLKLIENGQVDLSDTIGTWITGYPNINGQITIQQILNHTSGIANYNDSPVFNDSVVANFNRIWTKPELLIYVLAPSFVPGTDWEYSNSNYIIASMIEEQIVGNPIQQILRDSILNPLNLMHTFFPPYETATFPYAQVYTDLGAGFSFWNLPLPLYTVPNASGALVSNAEDNTKFWQALFSGQIIKQNTLQDSMLNWTYLDATYTYGLGIFKEQYFGNTVFSHGGSFIGELNSNLVDTTNNIYITVLSNQDSIDIVDVLSALYEVTLQYGVTAVSEISQNNFLLDVIPNPTNTHLFFSTKERMQSYSIFSLNGQLIQDGKINGSEIDMSAFKSGTYFIVFKNDKGNSVTKKVIWQ